MHCPGERPRELLRRELLRRALSLRTHHPVASIMVAFTALAAATCHVAAAFSAADGVAIKRLVALTALRITHRPALLPLPGGPQVT